MILYPHSRQRIGSRDLISFSVWHSKRKQKHENDTKSINKHIACHSKSHYTHHGFGTQFNAWHGFLFSNLQCGLSKITCTISKNMHDHALYLHVLSSSPRRQIVERPSTFAEKVTFQLRFLLTSADIYHCLFGGPLALCLLISFHINNCFFDKITTGFVSFFGLKKVKHNFAHGNSNADIFPLVKPLEALLPIFSEGRGDICTQAIPECIHVSD